LTKERQRRFKFMVYTQTTQGFEAQQLISAETERGCVDLVLGDKINYNVISLYEQQNVCSHS